MQTIADLHTHLTDHHDIVWNPRIPLIGENHHFRGLLNNPGNVPEALLKHCQARAEKTESNTLVAIINFDDTRAEDTLNRLADKAQREGLDPKMPKPYFLSITQNGRTTTYTTGQEIPTTKGHLLVLTAGQNIESTLLDYTIKAARFEYNAIITGDHVLGPKSISLSREDIEKYAEYFDAINVWDSNFGPALHEQQMALAEDLEIPIYSASDSHRIRDIFSSATVLEDFDPTSPDPRESLRQAIRAPNKELKYGSNGPLEKYRHLIGTQLVGNVAMPLKIMVRD